MNCILSRDSSVLLRSDFHVECKNEKKILFSIAEIVEKRPPLFSIPHNLLLPFAYLSEMFARLFNKEDIMLTVDSLRMSKKKMFFSTEKAKNLLDYEPREAIKGIKDAIDWFKENRYF